MMFGIGDIARAFTGLGSGLVRGIGGIGRKIKRLGEADGVDGAAPSLSTAPSFNRAQNPGVTARQGLRGIEDAVAAAENGAREDYGTKPAPLLDGGLPDLPISRRDLPIPALTPPPSSAELHSPLPSLRPAPRLSVAPGAPSTSPAMEARGLAPTMDFDRRNLPLPSLPGHPGGPISYNPVDAAKYDYTMAGARRDAEGNLTGGFKRDWKQSALSTLAGAARGYATTGDIGGLIGGAAAGGAGSLISPPAGREFNFDTLYRPELESRQARERAEKDRAVAEIFNQAKLDDLRATTEERRAQARKLGQPERRTVSRTTGINRQTGQREFFDANDPAQLALHDPEPPKSAARSQLRLGQNTETGEVDYYNPSDPEQAAIFRPYQFQRERQQPGGVLAQIGKIKKLKRNASQLWGAWGKETDPEKRRLAAEAAQDAQAVYNDEVAALGEAFPDEFEVGGFTEPNGNQGWGYYKRRDGGGQAPQPRGSSRPAGQRKVVVGADFVKHVASALKITPEEAVRRIKEDGYEVR